MKMYRIGRIRGVVYQNHWMSMHRIPPLPLWLVGWFVIPFEDFKLWRQKKHERMIEERRRQDDGNRPPWAWDDDDNAPPARTRADDRPPWLN